MGQFEFTAGVRPRALPYRWLAKLLWLGLLGLAGLSACAPALNWRDVRLPDSSLSLQFPCRPDTQVRSVVLAGTPVPLTLRVCSAGELTFGLIQADMGNPAQVGPALAALQASAAANIAAEPGATRPQTVPGATPQPGAGRTHLAGHRPDGAPVRLHSLVFAHGLLAFQATVLGVAPTEDVADTYFGTIRFLPCGRVVSNCVRLATSQRS